VPGGQYFVEITMDDSNMMSETNESNNAKNFAVTVPSNTPGGVQPDAFDSNGQRNDTWDDAANLGGLGIFTQTALTVHWGFDRDYFAFDATSTGTGTISTTGSGNIDLYLYDERGEVLKQSTLTGASESVSWNFQKDTKYYVMVQTYNSTLSSNYQIAWNIKPVVEYAAPVALASEIGLRPGKFTIARNGPVTSPVTIPLTIGGTAVRNADYTLSSPDGTLSGNNITIGNLSSLVTIYVTPIQDNIAESNETVTLAIASGSAFVSAGGTQTVVISDRLIPRPPIAPTPPVSITFGGFGDRRIFGQDVDSDGERNDDALLAI
jgi:hypothetical protein